MLTTLVLDQTKFHREEKELQGYAKTESTEHLHKGSTLENPCLWEDF